MAVWAGVAFAGAAVGVFLGLAPTGALLGGGSLALGAAAAAAAARRLPAVRGALVAAFLLRTSLAVYQAYLGSLPGSGADDVWIEDRAWVLAQLDWDRLGAALTSGSRLYMLMLAALYKLLDRSMLMVLGINVLLGTLVVAAAFGVARLLWGERPAVAAAWGVALFPTLAMNSALVLREMVVIFPFTLGVYFIVLWHRTQRVGHLGAALALLMVASGFHSAMVFPTAGVVYVSLRARAARGARVRGLRRGMRLAAGMALSVLVVVLMVRTGWGLDKLGPLESLSVETLADAQSAAAAKGGATYLQGLPIRGPLDLVWQMPIRVAYLLFTPFPWMVRGMADLMGLMDGLVYLAMAVMIARTLPRILHDRAARAVLLLAGVTIAVFAASVSNYGTAIRHRAKTAPLLAALAAGALVRERRALAGTVVPAPAPVLSPPLPVHAGR